MTTKVHCIKLTKSMQIAMGFVSRLVAAQEKLRHGEIGEIKVSLKEIPILHDMRLTIRHDNFFRQIIMGPVRKNQDGHSEREIIFEGASSYRSISIYLIRQNENDEWCIKGGETSDDKNYTLEEAEEEIQKILG